MDKKIALIVGYDSNKDKDAVGQYSEQLYQNIVKQEQIDIDFIRFIPKNFIEWIKGLNKIFRNYDLIHIQYPFENWGKSVWPGIYPAILKQFYGKKKKLIFTFHEWNSVHPLRKASILPVALKSDGLIFVSNHESEGYLKSGVYKYNFAKPTVSVIPIGVNLEIPDLDEEAILSKRKKFTQSKTESYDLLLGYFGFVYEWKQPYKMLKIIKELHNAGIKAKLVMAGDFPKDHIEQKRQFFREISLLGLENHIDFLGFIKDELELATVMSACDIVLLLFHDGVSARRSSFWYILELGVPLITTKPKQEYEFNNLLDIDLLINQQRIILVDREASPKEIAIRIKQIDKNRLPKNERRKRLSPDWKIIALKHIELYKNILSKHS